MPPFFRFPHTPHLAWLSPGTPRDDKLLSSEEVAALLACELVVEEKVDGANLGLSTDEDGNLLAQNRGTYLNPESAHPQFKPLWRWLQPRRALLVDTLWPDLMLFGEWCYATHSVTYTRLPDWFLAFDIYDRSVGRFWSTARRDTLLRDLGLHAAPRLARGRFTLAQLVAMLGHSKVTDGPMEGLVMRAEDVSWTLDRAKLVRPAFVQAISEHWSRGGVRANRTVDAIMGTSHPEGDR